MVILLAADFVAVVRLRFIGLLMNGIWLQSGGSFKHVLHGQLHGIDENT